MKCTTGWKEILDRIELNTDILANNSPWPCHVTEKAECFVCVLSIWAVCVSGFLQLLDLLHSHTYCVSHKISARAKHWQSLFSALSTVSENDKILVVILLIWGAIFNTIILRDPFTLALRLHISCNCHLDKCFTRYITVLHKTYDIHSSHNK